MLTTFQLAMNVIRIFILIFAVGSICNHSNHSNPNKGSVMLFPAGNFQQLR